MGVSKNPNFFSLERKRERYLIIHTWKILNGKVINISTQDGDGIRYKPSTLHSRNGPMCHIHPLTRRSSSSIKRLKDNSFICKGPRLFNCLPRRIRKKEYTETEQFKSDLDKFLKTVPDEPKVPGSRTISSSNSIIVWQQTVVPTGMAAVP